MLQPSSGSPSSPACARPTIVLIGPLSAGLQAELALRYDIVKLWLAHDQAAALAAAASAEAVVTSSRWGCSGAVMRALPLLKAVCSQGAGYDTIDVASARLLGVQVSHTPDVLSACVADLAWGLLLGSARRLVQGDHYVRGGGWEAGGPGSFPLTIRVNNKKLGILGLGSIGRAIAQRGAGFGMAIRYHNRRQRSDAGSWTYEASALALAQWADFLVATSAGAASAGLVSAAVID
ncbi:MAG: NAD(P)-dependent oxidoreductase, partial [Janthinobacterium lividum]